MEKIYTVVVDKINVIAVFLIAFNIIEDLIVLRKCDVNKIFSKMIIYIF